MAGKCGPLRLEPDLNAASAVHQLNLDAPPRVRLLLLLVGLILVGGTGRNKLVCLTDAD